ncbi:phosphate ABC transporter substrate-binding protein [Verrucomicrobiaceae bacterium R5-34]|uniref:Phosphate ABC transporter substrate-binding protein n=1 Tax=Oceaniferula flava TaxID=2800421 RepID=A0AAE2S9C2_9BACT|nr:phosphate ABC transporter substrate-binding protein [Oceaniferula flavus]MBK1829349.1 phosphate ABC transporter substrate-binding protein [Verrucomicrobiaceae bacterium R5-34]MBK1853576.1 phosphate ABC transporter substrate-binding protein [Oceaniferula flavus]MBM1134881.1 phosphate ABC transporter substrate-binding protein [Oceaniferula flavus]
MKLIQTATAAFAGIALSVSAQAQTKIAIKGSDTLGAKMVPQLSEVYKALGNNVAFDIAAEGSSQAFTALDEGTAAIGMSSRSVKDSEINKFSEKGKKLVEHVAGVDMIAVIVNKANGVKKLTKAQVEGIFTGAITDWSEVGGKPGKILVYTRNTTSGTYKTFQKLAMSKKDYGTNSQKMAGNEQIAQAVADNAAGIGYVGLAYVGKPGVAAAAVDGVLPEPANKANYALSRNLYYYTVGEPTGEVAKFITWATTNATAGKVIEKVGFIAPSSK